MWFFFNSCPVSFWVTIYGTESKADNQLLDLFNGLFSRTTWVSRHQKCKLFWILLEQEMMGWQWHQLNHMQIICTSLQTDNHASTASLIFLQAGCSSWRPTNSVKALKFRSFSHISKLLPVSATMIKFTYLFTEVRYSTSMAPRRLTFGRCH